MRVVSVWVRLRPLAVIVFALVLLAGRGGAGAAGAPSQLKMALLLYTTRTTPDWDASAYDAAKKMVDSIGATLSVSENTTFDQAAQVLSQYASSGYNVLISNGSGYEPGVLKVAPQFPKTWFLLFSDISTTNGLKNVAGWKVGWAEMGFLQAMVACLTSKGGKIGMVESTPIPAFAKMGGGATLGAEKYCGSKDKLLMSWTGDFTDPSKAKNAALALYAQGATVQFDAADVAGRGMFEASKEKGFLTIGKYLDESNLAPGVITSVMIDFTAAFAQMGELTKTKKLQPKFYYANVETGNVTFAKPFRNVPSDVQSRAEAVYKQIQDGTVKVPPDIAVKP